MVGRRVRTRRGDRRAGVAGDAAGMAAAAAALLADDSVLRATLGANAAADAALRFDLDRQLDLTIAWYREVIADWRETAHRRTAAEPTMARRRPDHAARTKYQARNTFSASVPPTAVKPPERRPVDSTASRCRRWFRRRSGRGGYPGPFGRAGAARTARSPPRSCSRKADEDDPIASPAVTTGSIPTPAECSANRSGRRTAHPLHHRGRAADRARGQLGGSRARHRPGAAGESWRRPTDSPRLSAWYQSIVRRRPSSKTVARLEAEALAGAARVERAARLAVGLGRVPADLAR